MRIERSAKKLHRVDKNSSSDWQKLDRNKMNPWQRVADSTHGIVTIGNALTLLGAVAVSIGLVLLLSNRAVLGTIFVLGGRIMDIYDGIAADMTKTKSSLGALFDESTDMVLLGLTLLLLGIEGVLPLLAVIAIGLPKLINAISSVSARIRKKRMAVTAQSKVGTAVIWISIGFFILAHAFASLSTVYGACAWVFLVLGLFLSVPSTIHYASIGLGSKSSSD